MLSIRMRRCPDCRRDYYDDSLVFCLDDGTRLVDGPAQDTAPTAIFPPADSPGESPTRAFDNSPTTNENVSSVPDPRFRKRLFLFASGLALVLAVLAWAGYTYYRGDQSRQIESIAVMPFVNAAGNPDLEYLSDGITESLINSLSQVPTLSVKARSSVFTYKGKDVTPQQVAKDLSVQAVLNGRLHQRGDQMILNVELVEAATGNQLWGDQYARKVTDLLELQSEIARDVSGKLRSKLTGEEKQKVAKNHTANTEAYNLYLRGRHHWNKRTPEDLRKSVEYFQQAIDKDPTYALAYAGLADVYILIPNYRLGSSHEYYPKARAAAVRAVEIDEALAEAHNALASVICNYDWKFSEAEQEWKRSLSLNPNYATAHQWYGEYLISMGRYPEALAEIRRAQELDPLSLIINGMVGVALRLNNQTEQALEQLNKTLEIDPNFPRTHLFLAETYQQAGRYEEALGAFAKYYSLINASPERVTGLAETIRKAYRAGGPKAYSRAFAEVIEVNQGAGGVPAFVLAGYWAHAGEIDRAFAVLEKAYTDRDDSLLALKNPRLDPLKSDPRYTDLLRRVGLPE